MVGRRRELRGHFQRDRQILPQAGALQTRPGGGELHQHPVVHHAVLGEVRPQHHQWTGRAWRPGRLQVGPPSRPPPLLGRRLPLSHEGSQEQRKGIISAHF